MLILIAKDVMDRAALAFISAMIAFFILISLEHASPLLMVEFLFGTVEDEFLNFHTITLIFGIMVISTICAETGVFQFIAFKMIQIAKGDSMRILIVVNVLTFCISAVLEDTITAIILIPLLVTVCRTLKLPPAPYLISQAIFIKLGATVLPISSIPSIMITSAQEISFAEYFTSAGLVAIGIMFFTLLILSFIFKKQLPKEKAQGLAGFLEYNAWIFVKDRKMMLISSIVFVGVIIAFISVPSSILGSDAIACTGAMILFFFNRRRAGDILKEIDFNLILYLLGIFGITGSLQYIGFIDLIGHGLSSLGITDVGLAFLLLLWVGALSSAFIDNIPITQLFLSLVNILLGEKGTPTAKFGSMGLALGIIWGDNLTPFGDTILVLSVAKKNGVEVAPMEFLKYSLPMTLLQLGVISVVVLLIFDFLIGLILILSLIGVIVIYRWRIRRRRVIPNK